MNCPDCESPLTYPEKCPCGWFATVKYDLPSKADDVKDKITNQAKQEAQEWAAKEGFTGNAEFWRKKALGALKTMRVKKV
jgi:hypothetical protein